MTDLPDGTSRYDGPTIASLSYRSTERLREIAADLGERFLEASRGTYNAAVFDSAEDQRVHAVETLRRIAIVIKSRKRNPRRHAR